MAELASRERLQPALLDRLTDDNPTNRQPEPRETRVIGKSRFRQGVLRDLAWLLNASRLERANDLEGFPYVQASVVNFGMPALSGETASSLDLLDLEVSIQEALLRFEPRILPSSVEVRAIATESGVHQHNVVSIEIRGNLWAHPVPVELLLRTDVDLETGAVFVRDAAGGGTR